LDFHYDSKENNKLKVNTNTKKRGSFPKLGSNLLQALTHRHTDPEAPFAHLTRPQQGDAIGQEDVA